MRCWIWTELQKIEEANKLKTFNDIFKWLHTSDLQPLTLPSIDSFAQLECLQINWVFLNLCDKPKENITVITPNFYSVFMWLVDLPYFP